MKWLESLTMFVNYYGSGGVTATTIQDNTNCKNSVSVFAYNTDVNIFTRVWLGIFNGMNQKGRISKKDINIDDVYKLLKSMNRNFIEKFENINKEIKSLLVEVEKKYVCIERIVTSLETENTDLRECLKKQKRG